MKKKTLIILVIVALLALYLNRSYAHIYNYIDSMALLAPRTESSYYISSAKMEHGSYKIVSVGDSLAAGVGVDTYEKSFPYLLAERLQLLGDNVTFVPYAVPGARTDTVLMQVDSIIEQQPSVLMLLIGVNDVHANYSVQKFRKNYEEIVRRLTQESNAHVYLISIPYIGSRDLIRQPFAWYFDYRTREFNKAIKELADEYSVEYLDLYTPNLTLVEQEGYYSADLFHPSEIGYTQWSTILYDHITR